MFALGFDKKADSRAVCPVIQTMTVPLKQCLMFAFVFKNTFVNHNDITDSCQLMSCDLNSVTMAASTGTQVYIAPSIAGQSKYRIPSILFRVCICM